MNPPLSRRSALRLGALAAVPAVTGAALPEAAAAASAPVPQDWIVRPFGLDQVELGEGLFAEKRDRILRYLRGYGGERGVLGGPDRMLYNFRANAGLANPPGVEPPGDWDDANGYLRGHFSGHYMSALAQAYASTGDKVFRRKLDHMVAVLGDCQDALAAAAALPTPRVEGRFGDGLRLTGSPLGHAEFVALPAGLVDGLAEATVAAWINLSEVDRSRLPDPSQDAAPLNNDVKIFDFGASADAHMYLSVRAGDATPFPRFAITTGGAVAEQRVTGTAPLPYGVWTHVAVTLGAGIGTLYVDGVAVASAPMTLRPADLGATMFNRLGRGQFPQVAVQYLAAVLDEFQVFGRALGAAEIAALAVDPDAVTDGLAAHYRFDDEPGAVVGDSSGNGRHAEVVGPGDGRRHPGFLAAYPETQFLRLEEFCTYGGNRGIWAPYYTCHKIMAGLLDAHRLAGSSRALDVAAKLGDWIASRLSPLPKDRLDRMWNIYIAGEYGGMNESLAQLHALRPDRPEYLETAARFDHTALLEPTVGGRDLLDGRHANQHIPQFAGYLRMFEEGADADYRTAAANFWDMVVPHRTYSHGGTGVGEMFRARDVVAGSLYQFPADPNHAETCPLYNMLKLSRNLFFHSADPKYMSFYEQGIFNQIPASRHDVDSVESPEVTYFVPVRPGRSREYGNVGTCCGGTGLENHTKYQDSIYFQSADGSAVYVNLYIASTVDWRARGLRIEQRTRHPFEGSSRLTVRGRGRFDLKLRIPAWADRFSVRVNGSAWDLDAVPGEYVTVSRTWRDGDRVDVSMPLRFHISCAVDDPGVQSVFFGPTLLAVQHGPVGDDLATGLLPFGLYRHLKRDGDLARAFRPGDRPLHFTSGGLAFAPFHRAGEAPYHLYLRRDEPSIVFGPLDSGVPNRAGADRSTFLDAVWWAAPFPTHQRFLRHVERVVDDWSAAGLLTAAERADVLSTADRARDHLTP